MPGARSWLKRGFLKEFQLPAVAFRPPLRRWIILSGWSSAALVVLD